MISLGGYYPTSRGWDLQFELELYNGIFSNNYPTQSTGSMNTAHYLLHACNDTQSFDEQKDLNKQGLISLHLIETLATYHPYTEWVMWDPTVIFFRSSM